MRLFRKDPPVSADDRQHLEYIIDESSRSLEKIRKYLESHPDHYFASRMYDSLTEYRQDLVSRTSQKMTSQKFEGFYKEWKVLDNGLGDVLREMREVLRMEQEEKKMEKENVIPMDLNKMKHLRSIREEWLMLEIKRLKVEGLTEEVIAFVMNITTEYVKNVLTHRVTPKNSAILKSEEFHNQVVTERMRQVDIGYDPEHDKKHGVDHLLIEAMERIRLGKPIAAAALVQAARELMFNQEVEAEREKVVQEKFDELKKLRKTIRKLYRQGADIKFIANHLKLAESTVLSFLP